MSALLVTALAAAQWLVAPAGLQKLVTRDTVVGDSVVRRATRSETVAGAVNGERVAAVGPVAVAPLLSADTVPRRRRAVEYSDWYGRRLTLHRIGSYAMLPLFVAEYALGSTLLQGTTRGSGVRGAHAAVATGVGALFTVNTVTGFWNLWEGRHDPAGRTRRLIHSGLMLAADAGFVATGVLAENAQHSHADAISHRNVAIGSMAISTVGTLMMWLWKD